MPVITPAYPSMCATFNITRSSMTIINQELQRGLEITEAIMVGKRPWSDLFVKHTFFTADYRYYISVTTASKDKEAHKVWSGYVESKVRMLVQKLETHQSIDLARAFNKGYDRRHLCKNDEEIAQVQEGCLDYLMKPDDEVPTPAAAATPAPETDADKPVEESKEADGKPASPTVVYTTTHYIGLQLHKGTCYSEHNVIPAAPPEAGCVKPSMLTMVLCRCKSPRPFLPGGRIQISVYSLEKVRGGTEVSGVDWYSARPQVSLRDICFLQSP